MLPSRSAPAADDPKFAIRPPPLPVEGFPLHLAWHNRRDSDPLVAHVRAVIHSGFRVA
jgi:DNA-binding transcriptional LysR family regulator